MAGYIRNYYMKKNEIRKKIQYWIEKRLTKGMVSVFNFIASVR